jgi:hypothetical protein
MIAKAEAEQRTLIAFFSSEGRNLPGRARGGRHEKC